MIMLPLFQQYGMNTDSSGQYSAMYKPFHLIGLELTYQFICCTVWSATGNTAFTGDVVAVAKRDLHAGEVLDGEGGYTVWGKLYPAAKSVAENALPIGLAHQVKITSDIRAGHVICWSDVAITRIIRLSRCALPKKKLAQ